MENKVRMAVAEYIKNNFTEKEVYNDIGTIYKVNDELINDVTNLYINSKGQEYQDSGDDFMSDFDIKYFIEQHFDNWVDKNYFDEIAEDNK